MPKSDDDPLKSIFGESDDAYIEMSEINWKMYSAHRDAGFTDDQAMGVVMQYIQTTISTSMMMAEEEEEDGTN